jgi:microcystin-dependent protein
MAEPFVGQVIAVGFNFAPVGWRICDGSLLPISDYVTLFNLIGTTFGGDGQTTFALPDLRGRAVLGMGQGQGLSPYALGQQGGAESVVLASGQVGSHSHSLAAAATATTPAPGPSVVLGTTAAADLIYAKSGTSAALASGAVSPSVGGGLPHENRQPSLAITYIISLFGIYPSQN